LDDWLLSVGGNSPSLISQSTGPWTGRDVSQFQKLAADGLNRREDASHQSQDVEEGCGSAVTPSEQVSARHWSIQMTRSARRGSTDYVHGGSLSLGTKQAPEALKWQSAVRFQRWAAPALLVQSINVIMHLEEVPRHTEAT
jgi:hypothetical protein